jgi:hypothetical protein
MDRSLRFRVYPCELDALFRLAFAPAPVLNTLASLARSNSPDHNAKGTQSPPTHPKMHEKLPPLVGTRFQVLFHSPPGVLFTFPSRYSCTIGRGRVFSLGGWSPLLPTGLLGPRGTRAHGSGSRVRIRLPGSHRLWRPFPRPSTCASIANSPGCTLPVAHNPRRVAPPGLGSSPFARRYLGNLGWSLLLEVLRCFSSPGSPPAPMYSARDTWA